MKNLRIVIIVSLLLSACGKKLTMNTVINEPHFTGIVTEVNESNILVSSEDERVGSLVSVSLQPELKDSYTFVSVGDEVNVYYNGEVMESFPTQLRKVYAITLKESVDSYCSSVAMNQATEADFERCGSERILAYEEKFYPDALSGNAKYSINRFDEDHLLQVTELVYNDIWEWYTTKSNSTWKDMQYDHRTQVVKVYEKFMFTVVSNTSERFAKYFLFGIRFDEKTNTFVLSKVNERNENNVTEDLLKLLQNKDIVINIERDFSSYRENAHGDMIPNVQPYDDYTLLPSDTIENRLNKIYSYVVNIRACDLYSAVNYCDVDPYYYYYDDDLKYILINIRSLDSNMVYYFSIDNGIPTFYEAIYDYRLPKDGETITFETLNGKRQLTRSDKKLFDIAR